VPTPGQLLVQERQTLSFSYDVAVGTEANPTDTRLDPVTYSDCRDGSLRVEIQLVDSSGVDQGTVRSIWGARSRLQERL
jgi:hypothetical protein